MSTYPDPARRLVAEGLGTALLLAAVVGSGIMGERLAGGNVAIALLANALATAAMLYVLIEWFGPFSGAHFNPAVTLAMAFRGDIGWRLVPAYILVQFAAAIVGVGLANAMFDLPLLAWSQHIRSGPGQWLSEGVATFGLIGLIWIGARKRAAALPALVACYIGAAYWFTASTSFANPAVTLARAMTDSFAGIRPADVLGFAIAQTFGAAAAVLVFGWLMPKPNPASEKITPLSSPAERLVREGKGIQSVENAHIR
jgi:glycerol uptake facilitator-like aquaporin